MDSLELVKMFKKDFNKESLESLLKLSREMKLNLNEVLNLCFHSDHQVAFRAAWLLENCDLYTPFSFKVIARRFVKVYPSQKNLSAQRHFANIMGHLVLNDFVMDYYGLKPDDFDEVLESTFDWLLNPKAPVAVQCNTMYVIFKLSKYYDWVSAELNPILEQKLLSDSPALRISSKNILKQMKSK